MNYRISVPSYVIPGTWLENIRFLKNRSDIHAVELLLFLWNETIRSEFLSELEAIKQLKNRFIFTLHLPESDYAILTEIIELTHTFVSSYCVHPPPDSTESCTFAASLATLEQQFQRPIVLENTTMSKLERLLDCYLDMKPSIHPGLCMDTAHLLKEGIAPIDFIAQYGQFIKTIHLNDFRGNKEHKPISFQSDWLIPCIPFFKQFSGIIEFELFSINEIDISLNYFNYIMKGNII
ncbi:MAG TPA: cobamide remodeling phosphodiesterase CbiR [Spirochaetia bacterium]|nr:cobamide remodeling phosphodiesterase CbiR [Spirochaetales bacterium]HRS66339.1 cobamide remodeling phosphodiesterase CbiR [Spirochaetia bacterium]HOT60005.1 cobamide remodeling phosphodiesterase CbiR [Spirochaetales bacterium]HQG41046.1 cobamide remodeling phosphodiesterase CbiR [Spirochaetales bacterium]HQK35743.1 cobamide remodeling phosphodiesterase CbiR [Spirochaetales bacterium]